MSRFLQGTASDSFAWLNVDEAEESIMLPSRKLRRFTRKVLYYGSLALLGYGLVRLVSREKDWRSWPALPRLPIGATITSWTKALGW